MGLIGFVFEIAVLGCLVCGIASNAAVVGKKEDGLPCYSKSRLNCNQVAWLLSQIASDRVSNDDKLFLLANTHAFPPFMILPYDVLTCS